MTDSLDLRPLDSQAGSGFNPPDRHQDTVPADLQITLTLPAAIVSALQQASPQPIEQQILALLQQVVGEKAVGKPVSSMPNQTSSLPQATAQPQATGQSHSPQPRSPADRSLLEAVEQLKHRLSLVETLLPRVEAIEGKVDRLAKERGTLPQPAEMLSPPATSAADSGSHRSESATANQTQHSTPHQSGNPGSSVAAIWMQIQQSNCPPASIPSTLQPAPCPQCQQRLMPFKSTGRVVCIQCGWTDKLGDGATEVPLPDQEIHKLLEQAAIESLDNMKPRKRST